MNKKIVVLEPLGISEEKLKAQLSQFEGYDLVYYDNRNEDVDVLIERASEANILVASNIKLGQEVLSKCPNLEMVNVAFTGVDHLDVEYCHKNDILVSNASGYSNQSVAELVFGLILDLYRNIKIGDKEVREGLNHNNRLGFEIGDKKFGVVGVGNIGSQVVKLANAFGADVSVFNRSEVTLENTKQVELEELFKTSDIISIHLPLNGETKGMISADILDLMKEDAILINAARGPIIDNDHLAQMLIDNKIAGAGIDVFDYEPPIKSDYKLLDAPNTTLAPHIAYYTHEAMERRFVIVVKNVEAYLNNDPINVIK